MLRKLKGTPHNIRPAEETVELVFVCALLFKQDPSPPAEDMLRKLADCHNIRPAEEMLRKWWNLFLCVCCCLNHHLNNSFSPFSQFHHKK